jgi:hypothetical protein
LIEVVYGEQGRRWPCSDIDHVERGISNRQVAGSQKDLEDVPESAISFDQMEKGVRLRRERIVVDIVVTAASHCWKSIEELAGSNWINFP